MQSTASSGNIHKVRLVTDHRERTLAIQVHCLFWEAETAKLLRTVDVSSEPRSERSADPDSKQRPKPGLKHNARTASNEFLGCYFSIRDTVHLHMIMRPKHQRERYMLRNNQQPTTDSGCKRPLAKARWSMLFLQGIKLND